MPVRDPTPFPEFDALLFFVSRIRGELDGALKRLPVRLTVTGFQVLHYLATNEGKGADIYQARVAQAIGVTPSSLSTTIRGLEENGLIVVKRPTAIRNKPVVLTAKGKRAWHLGLVTREDTLEKFFKAVPAAERSAFFSTAKRTVDALAEKSSHEREVQYLKGIERHSTRKNVRGARKPRP